MEKTMTTKEVAEALGCGIKTVFNNARAVLPGKRIENSKGTLWSEDEVTVLLEYIKRNNNNQYDLVRSLQGTETAQSLELEAALTAQKAIELQQKVIDKLRKDNSAQAERLSIAEPKAEYHDRLVDAGHTTNFRDTAKELGIPEKKFIEALVDKKYVYRDAKGILKPYHDRMEFFVVKDWELGGVSGTQTRITVAGKARFLSLFGQGGCCG